MPFRNVESSCVKLVVDFSILFVHSNASDFRMLSFAHSRGLGDRVKAVSLSHFTEKEADLLQRVGNEVRKGILYM